MKQKNVKPIRPETPSGKSVKLITAWECYVNLCSGLGMPKVPPTPKLAAETGLQMRNMQQQYVKALEIAEKESAKLRRQVNYFAGRSFLQRVVGVLVRPVYKADPGICLQCTFVGSKDCHLVGRGVAAVVSDCVMFKAEKGE